MRATVILVAALLIANGRAQTAVQTIELPALDRSRIAFQLDAQPAVVLGPAQVPNGYFRTLNRVVRFTDGRVALMSPWGYSRLHVVDASGKATAIGNFSPGVMQGALQDICRTNDDRLLVAHSRTQLTVFGAAGASESSGTRPDAATVVCPSAGTSAWVRVTVPMVGMSETPHDPAVTSRRGRARLQLVSLGENSKVVADLGEFDSTDSNPVGPIPRTQGASRPPVYLWTSRPFSRDLRAAADGNRIHAGDGTTWEIRTWDQTGQLVRILRTAEPPVPVTPEVRAGFIDEEFAGNRPAFRERSIVQYRYSDALTFPANLPAFADLRVDRSRRLWVKRYPRPIEKTQEWWVFTADGQYLGRVDVPAALVVDDIGDDYIAGSYLTRRAIRPESDAIGDINMPEYDIRVYRLRRP